MDKYLTRIDRMMLKNPLWQKLGIFGLIAGVMSYLALSYIHDYYVECIPQGEPFLTCGPEILKSYYFFFHGQRDPVVMLFLNMLFWGFVFLIAGLIYDRMESSRIRNSPIYKFLRPTLGKILLFLIFLFIAFAGYIQSWVFVKDAGIPKPPFFDLLSPFPFWAVWVMLILPLTPLSFYLRGFAFLLIQFIYFYFLACLTNEVFYSVRVKEVR